MISEKGIVRTSKVEEGPGGGRAGWSESENMSINNCQVQGVPLTTEINKILTNENSFT